MKLLITTLFLSVMSLSFSQLDPPSSMFWNNYTSFNPAAAGLHYRQQATINYRDEFGKTSASQRTLSAGYNTRVKALGGGIGLNYLLDASSASKQNKVNLSYSYHFALGSDYTLAVGASAGVINMNTRYDLSPTIQAGSETAFTGNLGVMLKSKNLTAGISSTQLNGPAFSSSYGAPRRNYHVNADYLFAITRKFSLKPQALYTTDFSYTSLDLNLTAYINKLFAGVTWRTNQAVGFMAGYEFKQKFRMGYCYEINSSKLNNGVSVAVHEFMLSYVIKDKPAFKISGTPSF